MGVLGTRADTEVVLSYFNVWEALLQQARAVGIVDIIMHCHEQA